jgi:hypothetical protein
MRRIEITQKRGKRGREKRGKRGRGEKGKRERR